MPCVYNTWPVAALTQAVKPDTGSELRFAYPTCIRCPRQGGSCRNIAMPFGTEKLEWCGYSMVKNFRRYVYSFRQNVQT